jgi:hypothetical protein
MTERLGETTIPMKAEAFRSEPDGFTGDDGDTFTGYLKGPRGQYHYAFPASFRWVYACPTMDLVAIAVQPSLNGPPTFLAYYQCDGGAYVLKRNARNDTRGSEADVDLDGFLDDDHTVLWTRDQGDD